jgi:hypothetical protein
MRISTTIWNREPTFHEWDHWDHEKKVPVTRCGRPIDTESWRTTRMRTDHAERIGKPCRSCLKKGMAWRYRHQTTHQSWRAA